MVLLLGHALLKWSYIIKGYIYFCKADQYFNKMWIPVLLSHLVSQLFIHFLNIFSGKQEFLFLFKPCVQIVYE